MDRATAGASLTKHSSGVGGGAQSSLPKCSSLGSWFGYSSLNQLGRAAFEPPLHHPEDDDSASDEQPSRVLSHLTEMEVDNLVAAL